ncbi:hypothetical protein HYH02_012960 [Chlamydomonas schloesseri]|uniref:Uncharacterized protein n=1 Tax=Chlamydomonas schloesseri TaxID=2026947 RepID=A0A835W079_9CHLO|nr:hypothetical protein HYH02_012960 [Chlamydomonas schloesseri]|eukprot:KAG2432388.1 hypothetical protein HYH02_012960 [Chlamydomonas schloesseri]
MSTPQPTQPLPSKEAGLFKQVLRFHELKQYKKAVKTADQILKKFPEHGETLAMKGLCLRLLAPDNDKEKKEEAYELVRKGVKCDLKSHVCWHVYGLMYRHDREYKEAIKCYLNALRIDKENIQILRDLALLQIQLRDLQGFVDTRHQLLSAKPSNRSHWITFAVAHHMNGNHELAVEVLNQFEATLEEVPAGEAYEHSEMLLYAAQVLAEGGKPEEALAYLDKRKDKIKDKRGLEEFSAGLLLRVGRLGEAAAAYRRLLAVNPNNYKVHEGLRAAMELVPAADGSLSDAQRAKLTELYDELAAAYPGASACRRIPLDFKVGDAFKAAADAYLRRGLSRGVPSLFVDVRPLLDLPDTAKRDTLLGLVESYRDALRAGPGAAFPPLAGGGAGGEAPAAAPESPQTLVWVLYFLARFYDRQGRLEEALAAIDEALGHTPTVIELYTAKSKILKHAGDLEGAAHMAETARRMDLQDRYLNSLAVKALLGAGHCAAAERTASLFTRDGEQGAYTLFDMQHMWYEVAAGRAHAGKGPDGRGPALKKFQAVVSHFADIAEDQFDFHSYCVRKGTLRSYVGMLGMMDRLYGHPFYSKAATGAVRVYLDLHDRPPGAANGADDEAALAALSPEERKKYKLAKKKEEKEKARKAAEEKEREEREKKEREKAAAAKAGGKKPAAASRREPDPDPEGAKLAAVADPLAEASKLVEVLVKHAGSRLSSHVLAAEVALRRGRQLVALAALRNAAATAEAKAAGGVDHPEVHALLVRLAQAFATSPPGHEAVKGVVGAGVAELMGGAGVTPAAFAERWRAAHGTKSLAHRVAAGRAMVALAEPAGAAAAKAAAAAHVAAGAAELGPANRPRHAQCVEAHRLLRDEWGAAEAAGKWHAGCAAAYPSSRYFGGSKQMALEPAYDFENMREAFGKLSF